MILQGQFTYLVFLGVVQVCDVHPSGLACAPGNNAAAGQLKFHQWALPDNSVGVKPTHGFHALNIHPPHDDAIACRDW